MPWEQKSAKQPRHPQASLSPETTELSLSNEPRKEPKRSEQALSFGSVFLDAPSEDGDRAGAGLDGTPRERPGEWWAACRLGPWRSRRP